MYKYQSFLLLIFLFFFASCKEQPSDVDDNNYGILDTSWKLLEYMDVNGNEIDSLYTITFTVTDFGVDGSTGDVYGVADCNSYNAEYLISGSSLSIENFKGTMQDCGKSSNAQLYIDALKKINDYEVSKEKLEIEFGSNGRLIFKRLP